MVEKKKNLKVNWKDPVNIAKGLAFLSIGIVNLVFPLAITVLVFLFCAYFLAIGVKLEYD